MAALVIGLAVAGTQAWYLFGTDLVAASAQREESRVLDRQWRDAVPTVPNAPPVGTPIARLTIPRLGADWSRVLLEGVDQDTLAKGPGHYPGTAQPGQVGNFAVAGHRVGQGAPFDGAAELQPCDSIVVETRTAVFIYRVLPFGGQVVPCALPEVSGVAGQEIVTPDDVDVIAARPDDSTAEASLLTITTCHPRYSARQRLIVHAVLTGREPRL